MTFILRLLTWWHGQTLGTQLYTWRKGVKVGEDAQGNTFYRTRNGKRRWVCFAGTPEATRISPDWHGWLHFTWDEPPTVAPLVHRSWEVARVENATGSPEAYSPAGSILRAHPEQWTDYEAWKPE